VLPADMYSPLGEKPATLTRPRGVDEVGQLENAVPVGRWYYMSAEDQSIINSQA